MRKFDLIGDAYALMRGFPWSLSIRRLNPGPAKGPVDLTGASARFEVYSTLRERCPAWTFAAGIPAPETGCIEIRLSAGATRQIRATAARYRLILTDSLGDEAVLLYGRLAVLEG